MSALRIVISHQLSVFSLLLILFLANLFILTPHVLAADCNVAGIGDWCPLGEKNYDDEIAVQRYGRNLLVFGHVMVYGTNPMNGKTYMEKVASVTENGKTSLASIPGIGTGDSDGGALGMTTKTIASLYNPPTSSIEYLANFGENIGLSPKVASAKSVSGSGADVISPVLKLWQVVRNISYAAFILVFIAAGLMIMFRQKLNPQTVIGIQQALPGLVIGLVLVTFSYFIAAFIVDLTFVGTRLVAEIFISTGQTNYFGCTVLKADGTPCNNPKDNEAGILDTYQRSDAFDMYGRAGTRVSNVSDVFGQVWGTISPKETPPIPNTPQDWWQKIIQALSKAARGGAVGPFGIIFGLWSGFFDYNIGQAVTAGVTATLASILVPIILGIALLIQFIRLIIALLMSYLQILLMVIAGPLFILISAIPGRGGVLSYWFKGLLANALVFPAVFAGFLFAGMLLQWDSAGLNKAAMPLFGGLKGDILKSLLAFGVLLGLPSIPEMVRNALGVKGPQGFAQAAIGGFMGGVNAGRAGVGYGTERLQKQAATAKQYETEGIMKGDPILEARARASAPTGWKGTAARFGSWINKKT